MSTTSTSPAVRVGGLTRQFGRTTALDAIDLDIPAGRLVALLGPSGSGKTTLLRILAGLDFADAGEVLFDGEPVGEVPARQRRIGFVFQHYALFRHMTVFDNIAFGLRALPREQRPDRHGIATRVQGLLERMQIGELATRWPSQLSGGQRQRVALARALAIKPRLLLLDEPFGALDARVRKDLRRWLRRIHEESGLTTILVTHDQEEALEVADEIVLLNRGRIEQRGRPDALMHEPATPFVFGFTGDAVAIPVTLHDDGVHVGGQPVDLAVPPGVASQPSDAVGYARPADLRVVPVQDRAIPARVIEATAARIVLRLADPAAEPIDLKVTEALPPELCVRDAAVSLLVDRLRVFRPGLPPFTAARPSVRTGQWRPTIVADRE